MSSKSKKQGEKGKAKKGTKRLIIIKLLKTNGKNYRKQPDKNDLNCRRKTIRITIDLSSETMEAQRKWHNTFQMLKEKNSQPKILLSENILQMKGESRQSQMKKN